MPRAALAVLLATCVLASCAGARPASPPAADPLDAHYRIGDRDITLSAGKAGHPVLPGSAERVETRAVGSPVRGDLDGDGDEDAALVLLHRTGGTGTFFYVAAALQGPGGFSGTRAVLLGDRIAVESIRIRNGVLIADYADRAASQPMAFAPTVAQTRYFTVRDGDLVAAPAYADPVQVLEGWVTPGREVSEFRPCDRPAPLWLDRGAPAFASLQAACQAALPAGAPSDTPVFVTLAGHRVAATGRGAGMGYQAAFRPAGWQQPWVRGNCRADRIQVSSPVAGAVVHSPLQVTGRARGSWYFEGDFPVQLKDRAGRLVASGIATAQAPWMSTEFVPFEATLRFEPARQPRRGTLVLVRDNPSDDRRLDDAIELPVYYR
jgi:hypothetical protein